MQPYRCYFLDGADHIVRVADRKCADDSSAAVWAETLREPDDAIYCTELWCRDRLVRRRERSAS